MSRGSDFVEQLLARIAERVPDLPIDELDSLIRREYGGDRPYVAKRNPAQAGAMAREAKRQHCDLSTLYRRRKRRGPR